MQEYKGYKHIFVATLGGQPQIVTFTLDLLLRLGIPIYEVLVIHPASSPHIQKSLTRLNAEFVGDHYAFEGRSLPIHFRRQVLNRYNSSIEDIVDEPTANGTLDTIGEVIRDLKQRQHIVHFSISGGRRLMAFLSFSAALLYFDTPDQLLHLYTPETIKDQYDHSGIMHLPQESGQRLIEVPFTRAAQPFFALMQNRSSSSAIQLQSEQKREAEEKRCAQVVGAFKRTSRQFQVLQALAEGLHPTQAAESLGIKPSTISTYTSAIYDECRNAWDVSDKERVDYRFVQAKFANYSFDDASISS